jgi:hypothetical protein
MQNESGVGMNTYQLWIGSSSSIGANSSSIKVVVSK